MSADFDVTPVAASSIASWDDEADVVIAGYGVAGAAAAVEAARSGAEVLVLERTGSWGGAAAMAGGFIYLGGGTALQKACGFDDSVDNMAAFLNVAMGPGCRREPDRGLLRRQRRALRLARRVRRAVQSRVLLRARLGTDGRPGADVQRRRKRLPVQHHCDARPARTCAADAEQEAGRSQRRATC